MFDCPSCSASFSRVYELRRHSQVHRGVSYVCGQGCGAAFSRIDALRRHEKTSPASCKRFQIKRDRLARQALEPPTEPSVSVAPIAPTPRIPLIPTGDHLNGLLDAYARAVWPGGAVLHLPSLRRRISLISEALATNNPATLHANADSIFATFKMNKETVFGIIWAASMAAGNDSCAATFREACIEALRLRAAQLGLSKASQEELDNLEPEMLPACATSDALIAFLTSILMIVQPMGWSGLLNEVVEFRSLAIAAHRLSRIGSLARDQCTLLADGSWLADRHNENLESWLEAEERCRAGCNLALWDAYGADFQGLVLGLSSEGGYLTARGELPGDFGNLALPCPDTLFLSIPATPSTPEELLSWLASDGPSNLVSASRTAIPLSAALSLPSLPLESPLRSRLLDAFCGDYLSAGFSRASNVWSALNRHLVEYRSLCRRHSYPPHAPPDPSPVHDIRNNLILLLSDAWDRFPASVRNAGIMGDGATLRSLAAENWGGDPFDFAMVQNLLNLHFASLSLYSPSDRFGDLPDNEDLAWTSSPPFLIATAHAIAAAELARSSPKEKRERAVTTLWPMMMLRAVWVRLLCLRVSSEGVYLPFEDPKVITDSVVGDVTECLQTIGEGGGYAELARGVVGRLLRGEEGVSDPEEVRTDAESS